MHALFTAIWDYRPGPGAGAVAAIVASAAIRALPAPRTGGSSIYLWFFNFTQILFINNDRSTLSILRPAPPAIEKPNVTS